IVTMDSTSSGEPGYLALRAELAALYDKLCRGAAAGTDPEFWYDRDGNALGPTTGPRPAAAAYATSAAIARACATAGNPARCALARGAVSMCAAPPDAETQADCEVLGDAYPADGDPGLGTAPPLPPATLTLGGRRLALAPACLDALAAAADDADDAGFDPPKRAQRLETLRQACGPVVAALEQALGASAARDPGRSCRARQESMGTVGSAPHNSSGQAGAFGDCYKIYRAAFGMCRMTDSRAAARGPGGPPAGAPRMSAQCQ